MQYAIKKLYHSITEAAKIIGEEQHVLRYWEREFSQLRPQKNRAGNRVYTRRDLAILRVIKGLLRDERYTVAGAREFLKQQGLPENVESISVEELTTDGSEVAPNVVKRSTEQPEVDSVMAQDVVGELRAIASSLRMHLASS
ncbi:MAG: MerR family transcriptional regulator [Candidatus Kapabacteria bacterium]|nr:MerR family transcriptional regulator [Candidatus Kapabacteria bacterium]